MMDYIEVIIAVLSIVYAIIQAIKKGNREEIIGVIASVIEEAEADGLAGAPGGAVSTDALKRDISNAVRLQRPAGQWGVLDRIVQRVTKGRTP